MRVSLYGHTNFETNASYKHRVDGFLASLGYKFGDFTLTGDFGYAYVKFDDAKPISSTYLQVSHIKLCQRLKCMVTTYTNV